MWPFKKRIKVESSSEKLIPIGPVVLTEEERQEVNESFDKFISLSETGELYVPKEWKDSFERNLAGRALHDRAYRLYLYSLYNDNISKKERGQLIEKALSASAKAYGLTGLPIYLYDLACLFHVQGNIKKVLIFFREFLRLQKSFKPSPPEELVLSERDIEGAIRDAEKRSRF